MSPAVQKRRDSIINVAFLAMVLGLAYVFFKYIFGVAAPFLLSFLFAVVLQRPLRFLDKKTNNKFHALWSILLVLVCVAIIIGPVVTILALIGKEIGNFISYLTSQLNDIPTFLATLQKELLALLKFLPDSAYTAVGDTINEFFSKAINDFDLSAIGIDVKSITSGLTSGISGVYGVVKNIPAALIAIVIGIIAWIFFTKDYKQIVGFIKLQLPDNKKNLLGEIKQIFSATVLKMIRAYGIIMFITFCELFLGLSILNLIGVMDNSYVFMIAIAIAIFDILPVAGSGGILIPWAIVSLILGNIGQAVGIIVIYIIISVIRQYIEPKIVGSTLGVHPIVTLAGLYFGLKLFGFMGMFIVPICVVTIKAFNDAGRIHLYNPPKRN
ncbi:MAG: sporulation integral membrane protein YtvI [Acetobacter sp.]|nr:sporulation integral membrane protein YtvI [Bacteroides sp.]MCM1341037.1 sporulation integral membrane protein YtvI [Acetobacter sp.]MCM1432407.1 sporulation integral membrane protein YtvI [Clostridiales bacterium]